jgi:glycosyltransferase involved in cell wall biosynthesis
MKHYETTTAHDEIAPAGSIVSTPMMSAILQIGMHTTAHGGLDRFFHGLVSGLTRRDIPHRALVFGDPSAGAPQATSLGPVTLSGLERLRRIRREAKKYLNRKSRPVVVSHFAFYAFPIIDLLGRMPHVVHFHGPWSGESEMEGQTRTVIWAKRRIERAVYRSARKLIVLSAAFRDILVQDFAIDPAKIVVIPGGIETAAFLPSGSREQARVHFGWPKDRPIILCVRRLVQRMGLEQLLQAMVTVRAQLPEALLLIAGKGPLSAKLTEQIAALGLSDHIRLLGLVADADLPLAYRAADLSIVPSQALEGFGLITLESLAAGTPVLVTPVGGLPEAVRGLEETLVLPGACADDLADGLIAALSGRLSLPGEEACQAYVQENFDWSVIVPRVLKVYEDALAG